MKFATLFSGGELFGIGARQAGLEHSFGIELDADIADVARLNDFSVLTEDVRAFMCTTEAQPNDDDDLFLLHASPPCQNASLANKSRESEADFELAGATLIAVKALRPTFFTLENVINYKNFDAFDFIINELKRFGYSIAWWHLNFADYGVPQTRKRLILIARLGHLDIPKPFPTHKKSPDMFSKRWIGWHDALRRAGALESLCFDAHFSDAQLQRFKKRGFDPSRQKGFIADVRQTSRRGTIRKAHEPCFTIVSSMDKSHAKGRLPNGRYFKMTLAAYAIMQTMPHNYKFGPKKTINQRLIGNGVPCLFAKRLVEHLLEIRS